MKTRKILIGTRASKLALWQAGLVKTLLEKCSPVSVEIKKITTRGDQILDRSLVEIGGKALFLKEIEDELLAGTVDLAVHSMKDVPYDLPDNLIIACVLKRDDPRDVFVGREPSLKMSALPKGAVIGTTSLRRIVQIRRLRPGLELKDIRGNVDTRLKKLDKGLFDGLILAAAGLKRLGFEGRISEHLDIVPACGQGAIGVECRESDQELFSLLKPLNDAAAFREVGLERYFLKKIGGTCQTPVGCFVSTGGNSEKFRFEYFYSRPDGTGFCRAVVAGLWPEARAAVDDLRLT